MSPVVLAAAAAAFTVGGAAFAPADMLDARAMPDGTGTATVVITFAPAAAARLSVLATKGPLAAGLDGAPFARPLALDPTMPGAAILSGGWSVAEAAALAERISGKPPLPDLGDE